MMSSHELITIINEFEKYHNKAIDWYFNSLKFDYESDEWMICRLKHRIYSRKAFGIIKKYG